MQIIIPECPRCYGKDHEVKSFWAKYIDGMVSQKGKYACLECGKNFTHKTTFLVRSTEQKRKGKYR